MEISISDMRLLVEMEHSAPKRVRRIAEHILDLNRRLYVLSNKRARDYIKIKNISESEQILTLIISDFLSLFQFVSDMLKKEGEKDSLKKLFNDLINLRREITQKTDELIARPSEKIYTKYWHDADSLISQPVQSLILPSLIVGWDASKGEVTLGYAECDPDKFYPAFHKEVLSLIGQFPVLQVFKVQKAIGAPVTSPAELRNQMVGFYQEMKDAEKKEKELEKGLPPELIEGDSEEKGEEIIEEDTEEIEGGEG